MPSTTIDPDTQLATLVETDIAFARVLETVGLDYCCGGKRSLETACDAADLEVEAVLGRLEAVKSDESERPRPAASAGAAVETDRSWESLTQLANLIVWEHHRYLRQELPELEALAAKVARVHGDSHPELRDLEGEVDALAAEMTDHVDDEEHRAFPIIKRLDAGKPLSSAEEGRLRREIHALEDDHDETATRLERLSDLTDGYAVPEDACGSYRSLFERLETLEQNTHLHVHRENNVLFPRAEVLLA
ncbi:iron-sulfur cluster repair di-iron protein [Salinadaptatus halalkaliphilus]|uniref:Iron-sulfur cluster repair di-iron protein n=1 Tax=Salinadaptatus halalkaliphilus TaxID=2419781 RepID=A0A4S3TKL3_9EURY|nr:iron-sulfur cluster repair di-iron protein [Salinadaptatus halalkaliphilus]THE64674.1 iron-sulfur cluster repair di-iron protein [Salinadaptatus halalkaliphilus]